MCPISVTAAQTQPQQHELISTPVCKQICASHCLLVWAGELWEEAWADGCGQHLSIGMLPQLPLVYPPLAGSATRPPWAATVATLCAVAVATTPTWRRWWRGVTVNITGVAMWCARSVGGRWRDTSVNNTRGIVAGRRTLALLSSGDDTDGDQTPITRDALSCAKKVECGKPVHQHYHGRPQTERRQEA